MDIHVVQSIHDNYFGFYYSLVLICSPYKLQCLHRGFASFFLLFLFFYYAGFSYICLFIDDCFLHFILQPPPPVNDTNPYNVFRPRERPNRLHTRRVSHLLYKLVKHFSWFISISELRGKDLVLTYLTGRFFFINFNLC